MWLFHERSDRLKKHLDRVSCMLKDSSRIVLMWTKSIYPFSSVDRKHILRWKSVNVVFKFSCMRWAERCLFFTILDFKSDKKKVFTTGSGNSTPPWINVNNTWCKSWGAVWKKKEIAQCKFLKENKGEKGTSKKHWKIDEGFISASTTWR